MKKQSGFRRLTALALALCMLAALTSEIFAADIVASGYCGGEGDGTNLTWTLDSDGLLTVNGKGKMKSSSSGYPWGAKKDAIKEVVCSNGVESIGRYAFQNCDNLTSITIPESMTRIEERAVSNCSSLEDIIFQNSSSITYIGKSAFASCTSLTSVQIPDGLKSIEESTFSNCTNLKSVVIPFGVEKISSFAFLRCSSLTEIIIPNSVTTVGKQVFADCSNLKSVSLSDEVKTITQSMFNGCKKLEHVALPSKLTNIRNHAFYECEALTNITIPVGVTSIEGTAFSYCRSMKKICFMGDCTWIEPSAFSYCNRDFTIYYILGTNGWTDSSAYDAAAGTWNGYPLKTWDGKTIPEETKISVPTGKYCIRAIDESGNPVSDATVWWNGSRAVTDENGDAFVDLTTAGEPVIRVVKSRYIEWTNKNSNWKKSDTRFEQVILYPESYGKLKLKYAKISDILDTNLVIQTKVLNLRNDGALIGDLNSGYFDLSCAATDTSAVTGYAVYQNKKEIAKSTDGNFQKLDVRDFVEGGGCFVRVTGANGQTMDTRINLQFAKNSVNEDFKFELKGNRISFDVSDDVPYIGGTTVSFDLPLEVPVVVSATTDKMQLGINLKLNPDKSKEEQIDSYIKNIKKMVTEKGVKRTKANAKALKNCAAQHNKAEFFKDYDITVCGYAEADFGSNTASGYILFIVDRQLVDYEYNTVICLLYTSPSPRD